MRTGNTVIKKFEYRGYKVEITEGVGYKKGDAYCWNYKSESVNFFDSADSNPSDFNEMIEFVKKELDRKPECIWIKPYDRNNKPKDFNLTDDIETKRRFIINDFEKQFFIDCHMVKWVVNFPSKCINLKGYPSLRYYPKIIQHNGFEIWFEFHFEYHPSDKEYLINYLTDVFKKLECKPVFNDGNMLWHSFNLEYNSYFSEEYDLEIRESHPRYGNKYVKFYINPDYNKPNDIYKNGGLSVFVK